MVTNRKSQVVPDFDITKVEKSRSTLKRWSIRGGKKVARRGHKWSQTGTAVSDSHPVKKIDSRVLGFRV